MSRRNVFAPFAPRTWAACLAAPIVAATLTGASVASAQTPAPEPTGELAKRLAEVAFEHYAQAPGYSEGPIWFAGDVYFCSGGLLRVDGKNRAVSKAFEIGPAGTAAWREDQTLVCDNKHRALLIASAGMKSLSVLVDQFEGKPLGSLNDVTVDAAGSIYWTDPENSSAKNPVGKVMRRTPSGRVELAAGGLAFPNGLDVDPAGKHLYVIESQSKKILRYEITPEYGPLGKPETFFDLGGSGGDGCAFDEQGNLWVADFHRPETGKGRIAVLSPKAEVLAWLNVPAKVVSNITFGGPKRDEIFCTTGDPPGVFHAKVGVAGFEGHRGKPIPKEFYGPLDEVPLVPHVDAERLRAALAALSKAKPVEGRLPDEAWQTWDRQRAELEDKTLAGQLGELRPHLEARVRELSERDALIAEIKRLGGKATLGVVAPYWLRQVAGDSSLAIFQRLRTIELNERTDGHKPPEPKPDSQRVTDEWLARLARETDLRRLELSGTAVTSAGMEHLRGLVALERLNLCLTSVDDAGLAPLARMPSLKRLTICSSKINGSGMTNLNAPGLESINLHSSPASDAGLEAISKFSGLRRLEIVHTQVTDKGLAHLEKLTNLRQLHVASHSTTERGLPFLRKLTELYELDVYEKPASNFTIEQAASLPKLRMLRLFDGSFDDAGVKHLASSTTLEELVLQSGQITDAAVEHLAKLKRLRKVQISGAKITPAAKDRIHELLPTAETP